MSPEGSSERSFLIGRDRIDYTEFGSGDSWVVLIHGLLMPRKMHEPLATALAEEGLHVVTVDLLGHGTSDRPADQFLYSMTAFAEQVILLLDHLGAAQAVIGGTSLGANVSLEAAAIAPDRIRGLLVEMPVLDNALDVGLLAFGPLMLAARHAPFTISAPAFAARLIRRGKVPFWAGIVLDTMNQQPGPMGDLLHGIVFGRIAPPARLRRNIQSPVLVVGHPSDPIHPATDATMLATEVPNSRFVRARSILEWRFQPERLTAEAAVFAKDCWKD